MSFPSVDRGNGYVSDVLSGKIPACKWVKLACERHIEDIKLSKRATFNYFFDENAAERVCKFIQMMPHTKGKWANKKQRLVLEPWQCFFVMSIFGWMRKDNGKRRYRKALLFVPRKNGKSALAAAIGNYMLCADKEYGAEVYSGATTEKQAYEVFKPAKIMAQQTPDLKDYFGLSIFASNISIAKTGAKFEPIIGNPGDGSSPSCAIIDEFHEHKDDGMYDTMITGMGAREQPLMLMITTAGDNLSGPCYQLLLDCNKILEGSIVDDETFALIYSIDSDDDWTNEEILSKANPNYGVSVDKDFLKARLNEAKNSARKQSAYQTKHLNVWVGSRSAYFNVEKWRQCEDSGLKLDDFEGQTCYVGLDLASKVDIAALELLFPVNKNEYVRFGKYYLPESAIENGVNDHYRGWMKEGWLTITDGEIIDYSVIKDDIIDISTRFNVKVLAYDPFQATMLVTELMNEGINVVEIRPTVQNFSDPMKTLDGLIRSGSIQHSGDPVMTWMISNVVAREDAKDNVYPRKERQENKIDGVISLLMALNRAINDTEPDFDDVINNLLSCDL